MPHFNFIDIGTSDFDYTIPQPLEYGIYIEPLDFYLDSIPEYPNCFKENCAISDSNDFIEIYYVKPEDIKKYNLPNWFRGCNSVLQPHPTVNNILKEKKLDISKIVNKKKIKSLNISDIYLKYNVTSVDIIKIDTEGHDCHIVRQILESHIHPKIIFFEINELSDNSLVENTVNLLSKNNYEQKSEQHANTCFIKSS